MNTQIVENKLEAAGRTSGTSNTAESKAATRAIAALIRGAFPATAGYTVKQGAGHFYCSGFVRNDKTGKIGYFMFSDYRYFPDSVLWRSASSFGDFTGGRNNSGRVAGLVDGIRGLVD